MSVPSPSGPPPELRITLGRRAYRWPFRVCLAALTVGLLGALSSRAGAVYGGGLLAALAAAWALVIHRTRLVVTIGEKGLVLRRGSREAAVPADAVEAVGIVWPVADPVWTVWFDADAAPGVDAVTTVTGPAAALVRARSLPSGWLPAVHAAARDLGVPWRVVDDEGEEVEPPPENALSRADHVLVDGMGRYRDQRGGAVLAVACGPGFGRRTIVLRDPHAGRLLVFKTRYRLTGRDVTRVSDADGRRLGTIRGLREPSFHTVSGMLLGTTRQVGDRHVVTGIDGRESASLGAGGGADGVRLERSPSAPDPLRTLALALPMVVRNARSS